MQQQQQKKIIIITRNYKDREIDFFVTLFLCKLSAVKLIYIPLSCFLITVAVLYIQSGQEYMILLHVYSYASHFSVAVRESWTFVGVDCRMIDSVDDLQKPEGSWSCVVHKELLIHPLLESEQTNKTFDWSQNIRTLIHNIVLCWKVYYRMGLMTN